MRRRCSATRSGEAASRLFSELKTNESRSNAIARFVRRSAITSEREPAFFMRAVLFAARRCISIRNYPDFLLANRAPVYEQSFHRIDHIALQDQGIDRSWRY